MGTLRERQGELCLVEKVDLDRGEGRGVQIEDFSPHNPLSTEECIRLKKRCGNTVVIFGVLCMNYYGEKNAFLRSVGMPFPSVPTGNDPWFRISSCFICWVHVKKAKGGRLKPYYTLAGVKL